jgi:chromosomal replication initiation ATPase DnaA
VRKSVAEVLSEVATKHGLTANDIKGRSRLTKFVIARQEAYYQVFIQCPHISYPEMSRRIGGRDHTTCLYGVKKHCKRNNLSYDTAREIRAQQRIEASVWIRSTVIPRCADDYRRASSIYSQGIAA